MIDCTITTGRRYPLFELMLDSFMRNCKDYHHIEKIFVCDDGSSEIDRERMIRKYPIELYRSNSQAESLNILFSKVRTEWFLHLEDDWEFVKPGRYIEEMMKIAKAEPEVKNVILKKWEPYRRENLKKIGRLRYVIHEFNLNCTQDVIDKTDCAWYGWSLNPGIQNKKVVQELGTFHNHKSTSRWWDKEKAKKYMDLGYKRASIYKNYIIHTGITSLYDMKREDCRRERNCMDYPGKCEYCKISL